MNVRVGAASDIGQVREGNEDAFLVLEPLYAVADGMGGHRGGEVASHLALETIQKMFEQDRGTLGEQVTEANRAVYERSQLDRAVAGMGTTLTAAMVDAGRVRLAHVGDSRAYLLRAGRLTLLTEDHTLVHRMVAEGEITAAEAETHPHRSVLTRALGVDMTVQVDEGDIEVVEGDRLLLCTDGLTGMVPEGKILEILASTPDPQAAVEKLVQHANRAGGVDNITAVILDFGEGMRDGATKEAQIPHQLTREQPTPLPRGSDITVVGTQIPGPPAEGSAPSPGRSPSSGAEPSRGPEPRRRARRVGIGLTVTLVLVVLAFVGIRLYLDSQWFVGVSDGRVAIFRGVPAEIAGVDLHSVVIETTILAADAQSLPLYRELPDGITATDRTAANEIVEQIRVDVARAQPGS